MKKTTFSAIVLIFIASFNNSYSSPILQENQKCDEGSSTQPRLKVSLPKFPGFRANSLELSAEKKDREIQLLTKGSHKLSAGNVDEAMLFFNEAISAYGSPLGYLYAGALISDDYTSERYLKIAQLAAQDNVIPEDIFEQHVAYLIEVGLLSIS